MLNRDDARRYNEWYQSDIGRTAALVQKSLLLRLWSPSASQRVLQVGCGTGIFLEWFAQLGHQVTGIEPSDAMLNIAQLRLPQRIYLEHGHADDLPYEDNAFDTVALISVLEYVDDPLQVLTEAFRVARRHVLLGVANRYSLISCQHYLEQLWKPRVFNDARFFSVFQLRRMVETVMSGPVPHRWGTCLSLPYSMLRYLRFLECSRYFQWHPLGHFIGMRIDLRYPLQTLQDPLFCEIGASLEARFHAYWRHHREKASGNGSRRQILELHSSQTHFDVDA
ncbi:MAG: class I SAM-dependent methyltransferase [Desulforhabdus sp.]|jgi:SAM-dependent methyltransferase|nr:class I SAM-dependent methyltransferase [Desulforhabdus sp.]